MERKTPQEKKRLSYAKDRRNTYGENDKSSRKNIRRRKRHPNRSNRRNARQSLSAAGGAVDATPLEQVEAALKHRRPKRWRKRADSPLALVVPRKLKRRVQTGTVSAAGRGRRCVSPRARVAPAKRKARVRTGIIAAEEAEETEARIRRRLGRSGPD